MVTETMTVHEALSELKTLNSRIYKKIQEFTPCIANRNSNVKISGLDIETFKENERERFQSIVDLIERQNAIKRGVVKSNATTTIEVGGETYTIAEAIWMKDSGMENKVRLLNRISSLFDTATETCTEYNNDLAENADDFVSRMFNGGEKNISDSTIKEQRKDFIKNNTFSIVEVINCDKAMNELSTEIDEFNAKIDGAISVSNAITNITINY